MNSCRDIFHCDWKGKCKFIPFAEVFPYTGKILTDRIKLDENGKYKEVSYPEFEGGWYYLCFWHFLRAKLRGDRFAWCRVTIKDIIRWGEYDEDD